MAEEITWKDEPGEEDYEAALGYLSLIVSRASAERVVERLRDEEATTRNAADILRASGETYGEVIDSSGREFSPVLLVVGPDLTSPLIILSGYLGVRTAAALDRSTTVPCKITHLP